MRKTNPRAIIAAYTRKAVGAILAAAITLTAANTHAQTWTSQIRRDHPRMFLNSQTLPVVRARALNQERAIYNTLKSRADSYNPSTTKDWGNEAATTAMVYLIDGNTAYLTKVKTMLSRSIDYYTERVNAGQAIDWYSNTRVSWLTAYDWVYNDLSATERRTLMTGFMNVMDRILPNPSWGSISGMNTSGITTGFYGELNIIWFMGLAAYGDGIDDARALSYLQKGYDYNQQLFQYRADAVGDDAGLTTACVVYATGEYLWSQFNFMYTWQSATGEDLSNRWPSVSTLPEWIMWNWIDGPSPREFGTGDAYHYHQKLITRDIFTHMSHIMHFFWQSQPTNAAIARWIRENMPEMQTYNTSNYAWYPLLMTNLEKAPPALNPKTSNLHARHFENLGQIIMRSGFGPDETYMMFNSGSTVTAHKQYDENNFIIYKNGYLALDSGTRDGYQWAHYMCQTVAHNTVLIHMPNEPYNGYGTIYPGPEGQINYGGQYRQTGGQTVAFETNNIYSYAAGDATANYRSTKCSLFLRQIVFVRPNYFIILDRVNSTSANYKKEWLLHTQNEPVVSGNTFRADDENGRMFCKTLYPTDAILQKVGGPGQEFLAAGRNWSLETSTAQSWSDTGKMGKWRMEVEPGSARTQDVFLHVIQVGDRSLAQMDQSTLIQSSGAVGVRIVQSDGRTTEVTFPTTGSHGGHIKVNSGSTVLVDKNLATSVTPQGGDPLQIVDDYIAPGQSSGGSGTTPRIASVTLSPSTGWLKAGSTVTITAREATGLSGLTASNATINGKSIPLTDAGGGQYRGAYTVQAGDVQGVNIEATNITLSNGSLTSTPASSSGSTLRIDTHSPAVQAITLSPNAGVLGIGDRVTVTVTAANNETGLTPSAARFASGQVNLTEQGSGRYGGIYTIAASDTAGTTTASVPIFQDSFENNSTAAWTDVSTGIAPVSGGSDGSRAVAYTINSTAWVSMRKDLDRDYSESWTSFAFRMDPNFSMPDGAWQFLTTMRDTNEQMPWYLRLARSGSEYRLQMRSTNEIVTLERGRWYQVRVHMLSAASGVLEWWVDGVLIGRTTGDYSATLSGKLYGVIMSGVIEGTSGTLYWDNFQVSGSGQSAVPVVLEATGVTLADAAGNISQTASSTGSSLSIGSSGSGSTPPPPPPPSAPVISSVTLSPNSGWLKTGSTVTITAREASNKTGLTASTASINGKSIPLADAGSGLYRGTYTVQAGDAQGVNIEAAGITLTSGSETSASAASSGSTLRVDTQTPAIQSVTLSPNSGEIHPGGQVTITATAAGNEAGLIPSSAQFAGRQVALSNQGGGMYAGVYTVAQSDTALSGSTQATPFFQDGFETNSTAAWTSVSTGIAPVSGGSEGSRAVAYTISSTAWASLRKDFDQDYPESWTSFAFKMDTNFTMPDGAWQFLTSMRDTNEQMPWYLRLTRTGSEYRLQMRNTNEGVALQHGRWYQVSVHMLSEANGVLEWWVDGVLIGRTTGDYSATLSGKLYGIIMSGVIEGTSGTLYWDNFRVTSSNQSTAVALEAAGITLADAAGNVSQAASSSGTTLRITPGSSTGTDTGTGTGTGTGTDTGTGTTPPPPPPPSTPQIASVTLSPNTGWLKAGSTVTITAREASGMTGLTASSATINGKSVPLSSAGSGLYHGAYTVQAGDAQGVNIEAANIRLTTASGASSNIASSSGSMLSVDTVKPVIDNITLTAPVQKTVGLGQSIDITVFARNNEAGLTASDALVNGRMIPLADHGDGIYRGIYVVQENDALTDSLKAENVVLTDKAGNASDPFSSQATAISVVTNVVYNASAADFNFDSVVNFSDFILFAVNYGKTSTDAGFFILYDINRDGKIDFMDFSIFASMYGSSANTIGAAKPAGFPESNSVFVKDATLSGDSTITVSIAVHESAKLEGFECTLTYDPLQYEPLPGTLEGLVGLSMPKMSDGIVTLASMFLDETFDGVVSMKFRVFGDGDGRIELTSARTAEESGVRQARLVRLDTGAPVVISDAALTGLSERTAGIGWTATGSSLSGYAVEVRRGTDEENSELVDLLPVEPGVTADGHYVCRVTELEPGLPYSLRLVCIDGAAVSGVSEWITASTLAGFVPVGHDNADPYVERDTDAPVIAGISSELLYQWASWESFGAAGYRIVVREAVTDDIVHEETVHDTSYTLIPDATGRYSLEIIPLTSGGDPIGRIGTRVVTVAPARVAAPGKPRAEL